MPGLVTSWSFSRLIDWETCPYRIKLRAVDRCPEPPNIYGDEGNRQHKLAEDYILARAPSLDPVLGNFQAEYEHLRLLARHHQVAVEEEWAFRRDWSVTDWREDDAWLRIKIDHLVYNDIPIVVDLKTGKRWGNEIKHAQQTQLYAVVTFLRTQRPIIDTELWYSKHNDLVRTRYNAKELAIFLSRFQARARIMTEATQFPPHPSIFSCKLCAYRQVEDGGSGACKYAIPGRKRS